MADEIEPQAKPIQQTGEAEWFPPAEDDSALRANNHERGLRWAFQGRDGLRAGWSLLLYILLVALIGAAIFALLFKVGLIHRSSAPQAEQTGKGTILGEGAQFIATALAALVMAFIEKRRFAQYGLGSLLPRLFQFVGGSLLGAATLTVLVGVLHARHLLLFSGSTMQGADVLKWGAIWAVAFLMVGLFEEFLMRGYLQFTLARGLAGIAGALGVGERNRKAAGFWIAALFFSFIFGIGHKSNPGESPVGLVSAGLIGLVFAFSLWRTGSLWFAVGWHAAWDWAQSFLWGVRDSGTMVQHHYMNATVQGPVLWSGGDTGPEGSILVIPTILITFMIFAMVLPSQPGSSSYAFEHGEG